MFGVPLAAAISTDTARSCPFLKPIIESAGAFLNQVRARSPRACARGAMQNVSNRTLFDFVL